MTERATTTEATAPSTPARPAHVVGIGASAGGLEALERFFDKLPHDTGMAFVVVQHLSPDFKSLMDELLARHTDLPIRLVEDGMPVEADHVYLIPPKKEMIISGGRLLLSERDRQQELTLPIDVFFRSLAQDCGSRAIAIVLSGGGSDGSRGIRAIHEAGGLVVVQDVESAQFNGMPKTAREAGVAQWVLRPEEMPKVIAEHARLFGTVPAEKTEPDGFDAVYRMLQKEFGIDFTHYKPSTVTRRIERRVKLARTDDLSAYVQRLSRERGELDVLYRDLLIGVTRFFRNEEAFHTLETKVLPQLAKQKGKGETLRAWIAGCATGEEAYSIAILLHELAARQGDLDVKIFATDVHRGSLEIAARGVYGEEAVANVSSERLERYFWRRGTSYQVVPELRQMIVFAPHDVIRDAPFTRVDLVSCRNLLIYLQPPAQQKVLSLFHFALNRGGVVFLGPSETLGLLSKDFETVDRHWHFYRKFSDVRIPVDTRLSSMRPDGTRVSTGTLPAPAPRASLPGLLATYDRLLEELMPPSLLVSERGELIHSFGGASKYLALRDGRPGLDVRDVLEDDLKVVVVGGIQRALKSDSAIVFRGVRLGPPDTPVPHKVTIRRIQGKSTAAAHVLISFEEHEGIAAAKRTETEMELEQVSRDQVGMLEHELNLTKENLQAAIEELETSNEELQAANEELLASNEELQSTNEELQSVNEELYTVNAEYQRKIGELTELTNDMDNLLSSTDIGTIFLDRQLRIRRFTPQIAEAFNLLPQDVGRAIHTFANNIEHPELTGDLERVLETGQPIERELRDRRARAFFLRILPYRAKGTVDGVVLTMIDVSGLKAAEDALFHERYLLNSLLETTPDAIYFKDSRGRFIRANAAMATRLGIDDPREAVGKTPFDLGAPEDVLELHAADERVLRTGEPQKYVLEKRGSGSSVAWDITSRLPLRDIDDKIVGSFGIMRDVTEPKLAEEKIQEAVRRRDQFLAMLSHELRNPLSAVVTATALLSDGKSSREGSQRLLSILQRQSAQMARLLDDLLEASRVTQNKIELRKKTLDVRVVARDAADAVRSLMEARSLELTTDIAPRPLWVDGDPARLQQIQVNLLNNAAKYTPPGGHVRLSVHADGDWVVVGVTDNGVGIAEDMIEHVFELFVQSKRTLDRSEGGIGVGLTLVRSLVALHGGEVKAESGGIGKGTSFTVRIPLVTGETPEDDARTRERARAIPTPASVVVVEDNIDSCAMLCELLSLASFDCESAANGTTGLELITAKRPHVAIVDVGLPEMDGFEVARRLRADPATRDMFLVALTGYGQPADRARALESGFDEHVVKPVQPDQLLRLLGRRGLRTRTVTDGDGRLTDGRSDGSAKTTDGAP
ncbi:MAG: PAS domain-containing protein [Labilithrix sp.]|nr:PAS domain-containing protein [Labilithrix sp.]